MQLMNIQVPSTSSLLMSMSTWNPFPLYSQIQEIRQLSRDCIRAAGDLDEIKTHSSPPGVIIGPIINTAVRLGRFMDTGPGRLIVCSLLMESPPDSDTLVDTSSVIEEGIRDLKCITEETDAKAIAERAIRLIEIASAFRRTGDELSLGGQILFLRFIGTSLVSLGIPSLILFGITVFQ